MSVVAGQTIGNYTILQQIGTGGMGAVYLAEHPLIGKKVALKVIHKELAHNREVVGRFFNEARSVNRIGNEHIVEVHDFGQSPDGHHFFIMEYLEGKTLAHVLATEKFMSVQRTLHVAAQIADALGAAHTAGIIHRDLKPDNIMLVNRLGDPDFIKILDFGLAKMFADGMASNLTAQGVVLGTPQYMSPEACESKRDIDHRTDIYAVGVLIFQMLCGQVPFDGQSMGEVLVKQVMHAPPAPRAINPQIPPSVEQIILRCLAKAPDARFATMVALRDALFDPDRYLASSPPVMPAALTQASPAARTLFMEEGGAVPSQPMHGPNAAIGYAATAAIQLAQPTRSTGPAMALPAPPPSILSSAHQAEARTMFDAGGAPVAQQPQRPGGNDRTALVDGATANAAMMQARRTAGMQVPTAPVNHTMVIGTPAGYKDRPERKIWPIALVLILVAAAGGVALAMIMKSDKAAPADTAAATEDDVDAAAEAVANQPDPPPPVADAGTVAAAATDAGPVAATAADAGPVAAAAPDAAAAAIVPIVVTIRIETEPSGADVWVDGEQKGKTPADVSIAPDGADHELILRHPTSKERRKTIKVTGPETIRLELEKADKVVKPDDNGSGSGSARPRGKGKGKGKGKGSGTGTGGKGGGDDDDELMRPPWERKKVH